MGSHLIDVGLADAEFLGRDPDVERPRDDIVPAVVAVAYYYADRFLGDDFGEHHVLIRITKGAASTAERELLVGHRIASAPVIGLQRLVHVRKGYRHEPEATRAEIVRQVLLVGRALRDADSRAVEIRHARNVGAFAHQETLPGVVGDAGEIQTHRDIAAKGPGRARREHVDPARLQRNESGLGSQADVFDAEFPEQRCGYGLALVDDETFALARRIDGTEPRAVLGDTAAQHAAGEHLLQRVGRAQRWQQQG